VRNRSVGVRVRARLLGLEKTVVEAVEEDGAIVISVRPAFSQRDRCPHCRRRCPGYDLGEGRRRWRALDLGTTLCFLEADAPRVSCKQHGVVGGGAVGATRCWVHAVLRRHRRVAGCEHFEGGELSAVADRVADRRADLRALQLR